MLYKIRVENFFVLSFVIMFYGFDLNSKFFKI